MNETKQSQKAEHMRRILTLAAAGMAIGALPASALDITIWDQMGSGTGWWGTGEDQEVEPNNLGIQAWDLEQFVFDETARTLNMIGGYNFQTGTDNIFSGDIFLATGAVPTYGAVATGSPVGNGYQTVANSNWKYNYAIVFDRASQAASTPEGGALNIVGNTINYAVIALGAQNDVVAYFDRNFGASPFRVVTDTPTAWTGTATFGSFTGAAGQGAAGLLGATHYYLSGIDLSFLANQGDAYLHFTMGCGNDSLMGKITDSVPDGGMTAMLLGMGMLSLGYVRRMVK